MAALRSLDSSTRRLYQQFFSYLLTPLAGMAIASAQPNGHLTEVLDISAGTELCLQPDIGGNIMFCTSRSLRILPMRLETVKQELIAEQNSRLLLTFEANYPLNEKLGLISLHINYLNDLILSFKVFNFIKNSLSKVSVQFDMYDADLPSIDCQFSLGVPSVEIIDDEWLHPLESERYYFHFPQQELYLNLKLPIPPRNWKQFTVVLDFNQSLPRKLRLNRNVFHLFTVPLVNNQRAKAQPITCNGYQERYAIRHPQPNFGFTLQKVMGVYEAGENGMSPLRAGILSGGNGSYEIEQGIPQEGGGHIYWLVPHFPEAFEKPRVLVVDALWQQPWYDQILQSPYNLQAFRLQMQGINWTLLNDVIAHKENNQIDNISRYINLLTLMHHSSLNEQNIKEILLALGSVNNGYFHTIFQNLIKIRLDDEHYSEGSQFKKVYYLQFDSNLDSSSELIDFFVSHVGCVLNLWNNNFLVEAKLEKLSDEK